MKKALSLFVSIALMSTMFVALLATTAGAAPVTVSLDCVATAPVVGAQDADQDLTIDTTAPATVAPGAGFAITSVTDNVTIPASQPSDFGTVTINNARDIRLVLPVPANATYVSSSLSGGTPGLGATLTFSAGRLVLLIPGPIAGGATITPPTITVNLTATGAEGSTIEPRIGGTSLADPGFELTINANLPIVGTNDIPTDCFPKSPNPALSTTTIVGPDLAPPVVTVNTPVEGGNYPLGSTILADFACTDGPFGSGVSQCDGTVADGAPIDTSTLGPKVFTVTANDVANNGPVVVNRSYTVVPAGGDQTPPAITITTPANGAVYGVGQVVNAVYSCDDPSGIVTCAGTTANGAAINTASAGPKTFTVNALDAEGNPATASASYYVLAGPVQQNFDAPGPVTPNRIPLDCDTLFGAFNESLPLDEAGVSFNRAPTQVNQGGTFDWELQFGQDVIPTLNNGSNLLYRFNPPTNGVFTGAVLTSAGFKVNNPTIAIVGGKLELRIASVVNSSILGFGDDPFRPPSFRATIQATGPVGNNVQTQLDLFQLTTTLGGTSTCPGGDPSDSEPNPFLTTTAIVDTTAPTISITSPTNGAVYSPGSGVNAAFTCAGATSCVGTVANGGAIDTGTSGVYQFTVTASDAAGNTAVATNTYTVNDPTVSASSCTGTEAGTCAFTVSLSNPSSQTVTVSYATVTGTASESDYTPESGVLVFTPGQTSKPVSVNLTDDAEVESTEAFGLALSGIINGIAGADGAGSIEDGTVTLVARFSAENEAVLQAAAAEFSLNYADLGRIGTQFFRFIHALGGSQGSPVTPPENVGPVVFTASYTQAEAALIDDVAAQYGLTGDELQWMGIALIAFVAAIN